MKKSSESYQELAYVLPNPRKRQLLGLGVFGLVYTLCGLYLQCQSVPVQQPYLLPVQGYNGTRTMLKNPPQSEIDQMIRTWFPDLDSLGWVTQQCFIRALLARIEMENTHVVNIPR
jgi:hypothetical protein